MKIKRKHQNEYLFTPEKMWVRNPYKIAKAIDINNLSTKEDYLTYLKNETYNKKLKCLKIDSDKRLKKNIVIVSDGYDFENKQKILAQLPYKEVTIIGTNRSLAKWNMIRGDIKRSMDFYVVNNPYEEAYSCIPTKHSYYPHAICSTRTNPNFTGRYPGHKYFYTPVNDVDFTSSNSDYQYMIDDYRNPICAALGLAIRFGVKKLLLFACDDSFNTDRPASITLENGLYCYEPQITAHNIIDNYLYWMKNHNIDIKDHSCGSKYLNADYITEEEVIDFFKDNDG